MYIQRSGQTVCRIAFHLFIFYVWYHSTGPDCNTDNHGRFFGTKYGQFLNCIMIFEFNEVFLQLSVAKSAHGGFRPEEGGTFLRIWSPSA